MGSGGGGTTFAIKCCVRRSNGLGESRASDQSAKEMEPPTGVLGGLAFGVWPFVVLRVLFAGDAFGEIALGDWGGLKFGLRTFVSSRQLSASIANAVSLRCREIEIASRD